MLQFLAWYLVLAVIGVATFPIAFQLLPGLAGRGYAFSRILGLLLWGYLYWILGSFGVLLTDTSGQLFSALLVLGTGVWLFRRIDRAALQAWWQEHKAMVLIVEVLFLVAFAGWTLVRAMNPDITATEKPMELAFLNAILRSPQFPPHDPWLSGYAISYYYFGFVIVALLAAVTGTPAGIAFNLGIAAVFGLAAIGAYGVLYSLLAGEGRSGRLKTALASLFAPIFILLVSNLEGFLEVLHTRGIFWRQNPDGTYESAFWSYLNLKDLVNPPVINAAPGQGFLESLIPDRFLWWWRASRVINDTNFVGAQQEVIDEFPFFSFLLSDLHPHVLAIPFVLLAVALALNYFLRRDRPAIRVAGISLPFSLTDLLVAAVALGALAFLNTWDFPIYVALFAGAVTAGRVISDGWSWDRILEFIGTGLLLGVLGVVLYLPFYIGFSSQAGGVLPNFFNPTGGVQLWIMFGPLFLPVFLLLLYIHFQRSGAPGKGFIWGFGITIGLMLASYLVVLVVAQFPERVEEALRALAAPSREALVQEALARRLRGAAGWITLGALLSLLVSALLGGIRDVGTSAGENRPRLFVVLMGLLGVLLVLAPEFFYLRDLFGTRMNTVFKFYYQAWILLGLAASYAVVIILREWRTAAGAAASTAVIAVILLGLVYPSLSLITKTSGALERGLTLDGTSHGAYLTPQEKEAVTWLKAAPLGTILEAVDGSYSSGGRFATHSGSPNVLGWVFHQGQWRGGYEEVGSRQGDVEQIYTSNNWDQTVELLERYGVDYIVVGSLENRQYNVNEAKFRRNLPVLFERPGVTIYGFGGGG